MKHWTIRLKITLWFAAALILVVGLTLCGGVRRQPPGDSKGHPG